MLEPPGPGPGHRLSLARRCSQISPALPAPPSLGGRALLRAPRLRLRRHREGAAHNERRPDRIRGGSTISQQTAKNVFLWPDRDLGAQGLRGLFHRADRGDLGQAADHGGLSQHRWRWARASTAPRPPRSTTSTSTPGRRAAAGRAPDRHPAQPAEMAGRRSRRLRPPPRRQGGRPSGGGAPRF